ncbi:hypothetical protein LguiA_028381 [Lonicera macranthoides]
MEWNLRAPSWDLTQFEQETIPNIDGVNGLNCFGPEGIKKGAFCVDLKLGQVIIDSGSELGDNLKVPKMVLSPSGSSKRPRSINSNGVHAASCLVDGCIADLSNCREYHRRHKVCELHSKTPQVMINGHKQRFCQQCSRFHSPEEFDEGKRSCRKRLDGHNRRRRKPQPIPLSRSSSFFSTTQGASLMPFCTPQVYPTTAMGNSFWAGIVRADEENTNHSIMHPANKQKQTPDSAFSSRRKEMEFSFLDSTNLKLGNQTALSSGGIHSDCVLSLLSSSSSSPIQTSGVSLNDVMGPDSLPTARPVDPSPSYSAIEPMEAILVPNANAHFQEIMLHVEPRAGRDSEAPQTLPFYWE